VALGNPARNRLSAGWTRKNAGLGLERLPHGFREAVKN
jgi:hypothetical protein